MKPSRSRASVSEFLLMNTASSLPAGTALDGSEDCISTGRSAWRLFT